MPRRSTVGARQPPRQQGTNDESRRHRRFVLEKQAVAVSYGWRDD